MRIALAQIDPMVGDLLGNARLILDGVARARSEGADLVVFPEMALCGYPALDLLERDDFVHDCLAVLDEVAAACRGIHALVGHVDWNRGPTGRRLHNSVSLLGDGRRVATVHKTLLPTYDVFDEARFFEPGPERRVLQVGSVRLAVTICEDLWAMHGLPERRPYPIDPLSELLGQGPDVIVNLSASPFHLGKPRERLELIRQRAMDAGLPLVYCNQVGANDGVVFDGNGMVIDPRGRVVATLARFEEDFAVVDLDAPGQELGPQETSEEAEAFMAMSLGVRDYMRKTGFQRAVIGVSGGIDSALVSAVAVDALGPDRVLGVAMPSAISSEHSVADARALARNLGMELVEVPIAGTVDAYEAMLEPLFRGLPRDVTEENIQARIRGNILMAISNKLGHLLLSTGNKSEMAVGYCTLYGDMAGGLAVLADVPKTLVYRIARWLNREQEVIPEHTITRPPSAELRPGQVDQDSLPPYDLLDRIVEGYVEDLVAPWDMIREGLPETVVRDVVSRIDRQEFKRRQSAPVIKITTRAFGTGRFYPVVQGYDPLMDPASLRAEVPGADVR